MEQHQLAGFNLPRKLYLAKQSQLEYILEKINRKNTFTLNLQSAQRAI